MSTTMMIDCRKVFLNMHWQCAIVILVIALAMVDCNHGNFTTRELAKKVFKDLQYPDFFVIGSMKCATTSLSKVGKFINLLLFSSYLYILIITLTSFLHVIFWYLAYERSRRVLSRREKRKTFL